MKRSIYLLLILFVVGCSQTAPSEPDYPKLRLDNSVISLSVYLPDADKGYYRSTRFDWSGLIERVDYGKHSFYSPLYTSHDPLLHDSVGGPAEEFGMYNPMGFADAKPGEGFVKIGVGILRKGEDPKYQFNGNYEFIRPGTWQVDHGEDWVEFTQELEDGTGWGYRYQKRIQLGEGQPYFTLSHTLENTGRKTIDVDNYNHNFTLIDGTLYGPDYDIEFPFSAPESTKIFGRADYEGNRITLEQPLKGKDLWHIVHNQPGPAMYNQATVRNNKTGAAVSFQGDAEISHFIFWAVERAACPEPFIKIHLEPGETKSWSTVYSFSAPAM